MKVFYPLLFFISLLVDISFAQKLPPKIAQLSDKDTSKVSKILEHVYNIEYKEPKLALQYAKDALKLAKKQNYALGKLKARWRIASISANDHEVTDKEFSTIQAYLEIAKKAQNIDYVSSFYSLLSFALALRGEREKAVETSLEAIEYLDEYGQEGAKLKIRHFNEIGVQVSYLNSNSTTSLEYWQQGIRTAQKYNIVNLQLAWAYNRVGSFYVGAYNEQRSTDRQKIVAYLDSSIQVCNQILLKKPEERQTLALKANSMVELANFYYNTKKGKRSLKYAKESLKIRLALNNPEAIKNSYYNLAWAYSANAQMDSALYYMHRHLDMLERADSKYTAHLGLGELYQEARNYQKASFHFKQAIELAKLLENKEVSKAIEELNTKYQTEKKEQQIKLKESQLAQEKSQKWLLGVGIVLALIFAVYLFYNNRKRLQKNRLLTAQKEEIKLQSEELKTINETLVTLGNFKEQMTGMIAHDLKNPLNSVIALSESEQLAQKEHQVIHQAGRQMLTMVSNMLDVYKFEESEVQLSLETVTLAQVLSLALAEIRVLVKQKNLTIQNEIQTNALLQIDVELFKRVFVNLLSNAIKYSENNSRIWLKAEVSEDQMLKVLVQDEGIGISESNRAMIFHKFSQVNARNSGNARSTGLGLTFCKMVVEAHGGDIGVISEEGKGTTFWFTSPIFFASEEGELTATTQENSSASLQDTENFSEEVELLPAELEQLQPYLKELQQLDLYEASKIIQILENIRKQASPNIQKWTNELENTVFTYNEKTYQSLVNI